MSESPSARLARVERALAAARRIADPHDELGREARSILPAATGLSPENVELALCECLEVAPSSEELQEFLQGVTGAGAAHVLLSANVFVAAHRAIALALAASARVYVRPSRREPEMARLLRRAGAPFELVNALTPAAGDRVWAYGSDETLVEVQRQFAGAIVLAHGSGIGAAVIDCRDSSERRVAADALAHDVVLFDQRGCLSPRVAFVLGGAAPARAFVESLVEALEFWERKVPRGRLSPEEAADEVRYRDSATYAMSWYAAGTGSVSFDEEGRSGSVIPPIGRNLHVSGCADVRGALTTLAPVLTALGVYGGAELARELRGLLPSARHSALGFMQRPRFDGPVDRRESARRL